MWDGVNLDWEFEISLGIKIGLLIIDLKDRVLDDSGFWLETLGDNGSISCLEMREEEFRA